MVLLREIKRRKVLHTLSLYIVGCWVVLQVVEVLSGAGLPPSTMRYVLAAMLAGFPVVLLGAWFFDISMEGIALTRPRTDEGELPALNLGDHALLAGIVAALALGAWVLSSPVPEGALAPPAADGQTLAVLAFSGGGDDAVGDAIAAELRSELQRFAGLKVLGAETSRAISAAGKERDAIASELGITSLLIGEAALAENGIRVSARLRKLPGGNTVWQADYEASVSDGPELLSQIAATVLDVVAPSARADVPYDARIDPESCQTAYPDYLRGRQLLAMGRKDAAVDVLSSATHLDPDCGVAWAALAWAYVDWTLGGFARAGAAARRALEINDALAEAWAVLAEIAEEERHWTESERLFLKALYLEPSNAYVNAMYAEALTTRGRAREALHYALEAYRYDPASAQANFRVQLAARYAGEPDVLIRHGKIKAETAISSGGRESGWEDVAEGYLMKGDAEEAARIIEAHASLTPNWYPQCFRSAANPDLREGLIPAMKETLAKIEAGEFDGWHALSQQWAVIRCSIILGEKDLVVEILEAAALPTEMEFTLFFLPDATVMRQTDYFRNLVVESGLLEYWREWGWPDRCRPEGDSFVCD